MAVAMPSALTNKKHLHTYVRFCCWLFLFQLNDFKFTVELGGNEHQVKVVTLSDYLHVGLW